MEGFLSSACCLMVRIVSVFMKRIPILVIAGLLLMSVFLGHTQLVGAQDLYGPVFDLSAWAGYLEDEIHATAIGTLPPTWTMILGFFLPPELAYLEGSFTVGGTPVNPTVDPEYGLSITITTSGDYIVELDFRVVQAYPEDTEVDIEVGGFFYDELGNYLGPSIVMGFFVVLAPRVINLSVPYHRQIEWYYCGPACLEMVFDFYGADIGQLEIAEAARTSEAREGTDNVAMLRAGRFSAISISDGTEMPGSIQGYGARRFGYVSSHSDSLSIDELKGLIDQGYPIIVVSGLTDYTWDPPRSYTHFRVVVGYDDCRAEPGFIIHDPERRANYNLTYDEFQNGGELRDGYTENGWWGYGLWVSPLDLSMSVTAVDAETYDAQVEVRFPCPTPFSLPSAGLSDAQATLQLPSGLMLEAGETLTKTLGTSVLNPGESAQVSWRFQFSEQPPDFSLLSEILVEAEETWNHYPSGDWGWCEDIIGGTSSDEGGFAHPTIWACDQLGHKRSLFAPGEDVYVAGRGFRPEASLSIGFVHDGTEPSLWTADITGNYEANVNGVLSPYHLSTIFDRGVYDVWVDSDGNAIFNAGDAWNSPDTIGFVVQPFVSEPTATGSGVALSATDAGTLTDFTPVDPNDPALPLENKPVDVEFPHGLFSFRIEGLQEGATTLVFLELPFDFPPDGQYWKCHAPEGWRDATHLLGDNDGDNLLTLTLTDNSPEDFEATPGTIVDPSGPGIPPLSITLDINPDTLNLKSKGKWLTSYIEPPEGYDADDVDISTILMNDTIPCGLWPVGIEDADNNGIPNLMVKFSRPQVVSYILNNMNTMELAEDGFLKVTLTIVGSFKNGVKFEASDMIKIVLRIPRGYMK